MAQPTQTKSLEQSSRGVARQTLSFRKSYWQLLTRSKKASKASKSRLATNKSSSKLFCHNRYSKASKIEKVEEMH